MYKKNPLLIENILRKIRKGQLQGSTRFFKDLERRIQTGKNISSLSDKSPDSIKKLSSDIVKIHNLPSDKIKSPD